MIGSSLDRDERGQRSGVGILERDRLALAERQWLRPIVVVGLAGIALALLMLGVFWGAPNANAAKVRLFKENLGLVAQPTFTRPFSLAVDQSSGNVLVVDGGSNEIQSLKVAATSGQFRLSFGGLTTAATAIGDTSSTTTPKVIKNISAVNGTFTRGEIVSGIGIPEGTTISKVISPTEIEISTAATATGAEVALTAEGLPYNITAANLKAALEDLTAITTAGINVSGGPGSATGSTPYTITFLTRDAEQLTTSDGTVPLAGGSPATVAAVETTTAGSSAAIKRFKPDGSPASFSALGTNVIDGQRGPGNKRRAECETAPEPASCDETPANGLLAPASNFGEIQVALDGSGNIYLTQVQRKLVYMFSPTGSFVGQLTAANATPFGEVCGVTAMPSGNIFVGQFSGSPKVVHRFASPPTNASWLNDLTVPAPGGPCNVAGGSGPTAAYLFVAKLGSNPVVQMDGTGAVVGSLGLGRLVAVNPGDGHVLIAGANNTATEYNASSPANVSEEAKLTTAVGSLIQGIAVDSSTGNVYIARSGSSNVEVYGPAVAPPIVFATSASEIAPTSAMLNGSVGTDDNPVLDCYFEYGPTTSYGSKASCDGAIPVDGKQHQVSAKVTGLTPETLYHVRLRAENAAGLSTSLGTFTTADRTITEPATEIGANAVTFNGKINPVGEEIDDCRFQYLTRAKFDENGTSFTGPNVPEEVACSPAVSGIPADFAYHQVSGSVSGLAQNTEYVFRLKVTMGGDDSYAGGPLSAATVGAPIVTEQIPFSVTDQTAKLQASIDPNGSSTTYFIEWGSTSAYGNRIPTDFDPFVGSGQEPVTVFASLGGLRPGATYHFRVVATNARGTTKGIDRQFETLNEDLLPNGRAPELVSPPDKRPVGIVEQLVHSQVYFQPSDSGNSIGYMIFNGTDGTDAGGEVIYGGTRTPGGWSAQPITPPALIPSPDASGDITDASPGMVRYIDPGEMRCAVVETHNPVDPETPSADIEQGVYNLYRWNASNGSYTLLTNRSPMNPQAGGTGNYEVAGASADCTKIVFRSITYRFLPGDSGFYEWDDGVLRDAAVRPDGSAPILSSGEGGAAEAVARGKQSVSSDGHFFFTATSTEIGDAGKAAIFVRKGPGQVVNASTPTFGSTLGARFEGASADGSRVFFLANYGLDGTVSGGPTNGDCPATGSTLAMNNTPCDLYSYDVASGVLTDISASLNPADSQGAVSQGVMAISKDGSVVYFAARGQLVLGEGRTYAQNLQGEGHANIYRYEFGAPLADRLTFVGTLTKEDVGKQAMLHAGNGWSSQTDDQGDYFLYASRDELGQVNPNGVELAYVYSHDTELTECLSCPRDGSQPRSRPLGQAGFPKVIPAPSELSVGKGVSTIRALTGDGRVIFDSEDALAAGAVEGKGQVLGTAISRFPAQSNIYEWHDGQISLLATGAVLAIGFGGPDGRDAFVRSFDRLSAHDIDVSADLYDLRSGGGFSPPSPPAAKCDVESGQCEGPSSQPPSLTPPGTTAPRPGNKAAPKPPKPRCKKGKVRRNGKCVPRGRVKKKSRQQVSTRLAGANRGGVK